MQTFAKFRKSSGREVPSQPKPVLQPVSEFTNESTSNNGYVNGELSRHRQTEQRIVAIIANISSVCDKGKRTKDAASKMDALFEAIKLVAHALRSTGELSKSNIELIANTTQLLDAMPKAIARELSKQSKLY